MTTGFITETLIYIILLRHRRSPCETNLVARSKERQLFSQTIFLVRLAKQRSLHVFEFLETYFLQREIICLCKMNPGSKLDENYTY